MVMMHVWFIGLRRHFGEIAGIDKVRLLFLFFGFSGQSEFSGKVLGFYSVASLDPGPPSLPRHVGVEFLDVGGWLTHGDLALEVGVDFLAVAEHRLIEWSRPRKKGLASIWAPASQDSSHVGNAGVGCISMRGARLTLPTFVTAQFKRFFDCGRAVRCVLPLGLGRFMHLVV